MQLREHAQILTRPVRLLAAIRANSLIAQTERSVAATSAVLVTESKLGSGYLFCYVTADNWNITIRLNFIAICGIILLISIVFLKSIPNNNMNS